MAAEVPFDLGRLLRESSLQHIEYHPTLESTSTLASELLEPLLEHAPALVLTAEQTSGAGSERQCVVVSAGRAGLYNGAAGGRAAIAGIAAPVAGDCSGTGSASRVVGFCTGQCRDGEVAE